MEEPIMKPNLNQIETDALTHAAQSGQLTSERTTTGKPGNEVNNPIAKAATPSDQAVENQSFA